MAETVASKNERVNDYIADVTAISLHSADPGSTAANEIVGGSPAYARKAPSYAAAADGATDLTAGLTFDVPGGATVSHYGLWKGTVFLGGDALSAVETYGAQGTYTLTSLPIRA